MSQPIDRRVIVYPNYLDSAQTVATGRLVSKEQACPDPDPIEMLAVCQQQLKLQAVVEDKQYPRTWWIRGRLRVTIKNPDGTPINPEIPNKKALCVKIAEAIKNNPNRPKRTNVANVKEMLAAFHGGSVGAASSSSGAAASSSKASATTSNKKKKGKK